jgi:hypothetical protein
VGVDGGAAVVVEVDKGIAFAQGCDEVNVGGEWLVGWAANGDFNVAPDAMKDEFGFITLRSERARDPSVANYNMGLPLRTSRRRLCALIGTHGRRQQIRSLQL